jgi:hypothetical protein
VRQQYQAAGLIAALLYTRTSISIPPTHLTHSALTKKK